MKINLYLNKNSKIKSVAFIAASIAVFTAFSFGVPFYYSCQTRSSQMAQKDEAKLPVIMYHLVLKNTNGKNKFIISKHSFEEDLKYISNNGYTTILIKDLIEYTQNKKDLPPKPILLTFDDGAYNNYLYAFPIAKEYGAKLVFSPIAAEADKYSEISDENPSYSHANWNQIKEMSESGLVEIQNHTYNMHSAKKPRIGCTMKSGETKEIYQKKLKKDLTKANNLIKEKTGTEPTAFFYPFGACSKCSEDIIKEMRFKATFLCESKVNTITRNPESLYGLSRFLRPPGVSSKNFFAKLEKQHV